MEVKQKSGKRKRGTSFGDKNTRTERGLVRSNFLEYLRHCIIYRLVYQLCETGGKGISDLASLEAEAHETNTPELPFVFGPCSTPRRHCRPLQNGENNLIDSQVHANSCILANKCRSLFLRRDPLPLELIDQSPHQVQGCLVPREINLDDDTPRYCNQYGEFEIDRPI